MKEVFATRFSELLKETDKNYEDIAHELGFKSKGSISKYANAKNKDVPISVVFKVADLFGVSPVWLIGLTNDRHYIVM